MTLGQVVNGGFNPPLPLVRYGYRPADAAIQRAPGLEPQVALQRCNGNACGSEPWSEVYTGTLRHGVRIRSPGGIRNPRERISSKMFAREDGPEGGSMPPKKKANPKTIQPWDYREKWCEAIRTWRESYSRLIHASMPLLTPDDQSQAKAEYKTDDEAKSMFLLGMVRAYREGGSPAMERAYRKALQTGDFGY